MSTSTVKKGLDDFAGTLTSALAITTSVLNSLNQVDDTLESAPTTYADIIAEINGYTPTGEFEELAQDELLRLTAERSATRTALATAITALDTLVNG